MKLFHDIWNLDLMRIAEVIHMPAHSFASNTRHPHYEEAVHMYHSQDSRWLIVMKVARISDALAEAGIIKVSEARVAGKTKTNPQILAAGVKETGSRESR